MKVLSKTRQLAQASLTGAPVSVPAAGTVYLSASFAGIALPPNSVVEVNILSAQLATDSGGETTLVIQNANLHINGSLTGVASTNGLNAPAQTGSALGFANNSCFGAGIKFQSNYFAATAPNIALHVYVSNTDASNPHDVTALDTVFEILITTYDEPPFSSDLSSG